MTRLALVPGYTLTACWRLVEPWVNLACSESQGRYEASDVARLVIANHFQMWIAVEDEEVKAMALSQILKYPRKQVCEMVCCVGEEMAEWVGHISEIEVWAKSVGCQQMQPITRPGWEKALKPMGYGKTHVVLSKVLQ